MFYAESMVYRKTKNRKEGREGGESGKERGEGVCVPFVLERSLPEASLEQDLPTSLLLLLTLGLSSLSGARHG